MCGFIGFGHTLPQRGIFVGLHGKDESMPAFRYTGPDASVRVYKSTAVRLVSV